MVWYDQARQPRRQTGKSAADRYTADTAHSTAEAEEGSTGGGSQTDSRAARGAKRESKREREVGK